MSVHTRDAHRQYYKSWWYLCISVGWIFLSTLKCKVDSHFPSALSPDQNTQCILGGWRWVLSCPRLHTPSLPDSPHALFSFFTEATGRKKKRGTNISVEAGILNMRVMLGASSSPLRCAMWAEGVTCVCMCYFFTVWVMIWLTYLIHALWWFRACDGRHMAAQISRFHC